MMDRLSMIAAFSNANGVSGFEDEVLKVARSYASDNLDIREDSLRNLYMYRKGHSGNRPVVQLDAHSDEVGFMVQAHGVFYYVIEGQIHIVGEVCEYILKIVSESGGGGKFHICGDVGFQLSIYFGTHIGNKPELIIEEMILLAILKIFVQQAAALGQYQGHSHDGENKRMTEGLHGNLSTRNHQEQHLRSSDLFPN